MCPAVSVRAKCEGSSIGQFRGRWSIKDKLAVLMNTKILQNHKSPCLYCLQEYREAENVTFEEEKLLSEAERMSEQQKMLHLWKLITSYLLADAEGTTEKHRDVTLFFVEIGV